MYIVQEQDFAEVLRILYATAPAFSREGWSAVHQGGERPSGR